MIKKLYRMYQIYETIVYSFNIKILKYFHIWTQFSLARYMSLLRILKWIQNQLLWCPDNFMIFLSFNIWFKSFLLVVFKNHSEAKNTYPVNENRPRCAWELSYFFLKFDQCFLWFEHNDRIYLLPVQKFKH